MHIMKQYEVKTCIAAMNSFNPRKPCRLESAMAQTFRQISAAKYQCKNIWSHSKENDYKLLMIVNKEMNNCETLACGISDSSKYKYKE